MRIRAFFLCSGLLAASIGAAQWQVSVLNPPGSNSTEVEETDGAHQVGGVNGQAALWAGTAASYVSLAPAGSVTSYAYSVDGNQQAGGVIFSGGSLFRAVIWSGTAASYTDVTPGSGEALISGMGGGKQVGIYNSRAALWSGTAASYVDLAPVGTTFSSALEIDGDKQYGWADFNGVGVRAGYWAGSASSFVSMHPASADESEIIGASGGQQVGDVAFGAIRHAALWEGTASSFVDLHPGGSDLSYAWDVSGGWQVGYTQTGGITKAALWSGTAASYFDLHSLLGADYEYSYAWGISVDDEFIRVVGSGFNTVTQRREGVIWYRPVPEASTIAIIALGIAGMLFRRRNR